LSVRRWLFLGLVGCASPLTVAEPRDGGAVGTSPEPADDAAPPPTFGEAAVVDQNEEPPPLSDPVEDAGAEPETDGEAGG
jgi:hypothetical protein